MSEQWEEMKRILTMASVHWGGWEGTPAWSQPCNGLQMNVSYEHRKLLLSSLHSHGSP